MSCDLESQCWKRLCPTWRRASVSVTRRCSWASCLGVKRTAPGLGSWTDFGLNPSPTACQLHSIEESFELQDSVWEIRDSPEDSRGQCLPSARLHPSTARASSLAPLRSPWSPHSHSTERLYHYHPSSHFTSVSPKTLFSLLFPNSYPYAFCKLNMHHRDSSIHILYITSPNKMHAAYTVPQQDASWLEFIDTHPQ